ncbi:MAG: N-acetylmuramoyl-L-alanine amidase, partial [Dehalococcoidia bacterium]
HREAHWRNVSGFLVDLGGFAYHLAVFPSRRVYLVTPLNMRGAHVASHNGHLVAVVLIGTFTEKPPAAAQLAAAAEARAYVERQGNKRLTWRGHRDWAEAQYATACPGDTYETWVPQLSISREVRTVYTDAQIDMHLKRLTDQLAEFDGRLRMLEGRADASEVPSPRYYTVKSGDVASLIAERHGLTWERFKALNPEGPPSGRWRLIHPGEVYRVA